VENGLGGSAFYSAGEAAEGRGDRRSSGGQWCSIKVPVTEEEVRGRPFDEGEMNGVGWWFDSAPSGCGRVAHSGAWCGGTDRRGGGGSGVRRWEKTPRWADLGRSGQRGLGWRGNSHEKIKLGCEGF
jgi:hypothetical protein